MCSHVLSEMPLKYLFPLNKRDQKQSHQLKAPQDDIGPCVNPKIKQLFPCALRVPGVGRIKTDKCIQL